MDKLFAKFLLAAIEAAKEQQALVEEDGILLSPATINLVKEIEDSNRLHLIEQSLINRNKELFMQLTEGEKK